MSARQPATPSTTWSTSTTRDTRTLVSESPAVGGSTFDGSTGFVKLSLEPGARLNLCHHAPIVARGLAYAVRSGAAIAAVTWTLDMGANVAAGGVRFRVWAPAAHQVEV